MSDEKPPRPRGRPKRTGDPDEPLHVLVPKGTKARLARIARERKLSMSSLVRRVLAGDEHIYPDPEPTPKEP